MPPRYLPGLNVCDPSRVEADSDHRVIGRTKTTNRRTTNEQHRSKRSKQTTNDERRTKRMTNDERTTTIKTNNEQNERRTQRTTNDQQSEQRTTNNERRTISSTIRFDSFRRRSFVRSFGVTVSACVAFGRGWVGESGSHWQSVSLTDGMWWAVVDCPRARGKCSDNATMNA